MTVIPDQHPVRCADRECGTTWVQVGRVEYGTFHPAEPDLCDYCPECGLRDDGGDRLEGDDLAEWSAVWEWSGGRLVVAFEGP